jgi:adenine/guanine phosphoribosyltransferase-like PRPP-binding protein
MNEENKVIVDVAAGTGTVAAWLEMAPDAVALVTGLWVLIRIWETDTVKRLLGRDV